MNILLVVVVSIVSLVVLWKYLDANVHVRGVDQDQEREEIVIDPEERKMEQAEKMLLQFRNNEFQDYQTFVEQYGECEQFDEFKRLAEEEKLTETDLLFVDLSFV